MNRHLKRALEVAIVPLAAAIVFFEQTLIKYLNVAMAAVARWPPIARLEAWLVGLPPYAALCAFVTPSILILPINHCVVVRDQSGSTSWRWRSVVSARCWARLSWRGSTVSCGRG